MSSTASEVDISNMALGWLGADRITSLDDESVEAQLCKLNYPRSRDVVLEDVEWTFAVRRFILSPDPVVPLFNWGKKFLIPTEVLRVLTVERDNIVSINRRIKSMDVRGRYIYDGWIPLGKIKGKIVRMAN